MHAANILLHYDAVPVRIFIERLMENAEIEHMDLLLDALVEMKPKSFVNTVDANTSG